MIADLLRQGGQQMGMRLDDGQIADLGFFVSELRRWNAKINLTAITDDKGVVSKHILDSLKAAEMIPAGEVTLLDIGSGAGFPCIPLKIIRPDLQITSVDAVAKKINFQRHVIRLMKFKRFQAQHVRVESLSVGTQFDVIISRAFAELGQFVSLAAPLLHRAGRLIAMKGPAAEDELASSHPVLDRLGLEVELTSGYALPFDAGERSLIRIRRKPL